MTSKIISTIQSAAVSPQTRQVLTKHLELTSDYLPVFFSEAEFSFLRQLIRAVVTDPSELDRNVAQQIDTRLAAGEGAGWRFATLPPDRDAYRIALALMTQQLSTSGLGALPSEDVSVLTSLLFKVQSGDLDTEDFPLSLWFEGFKVDAIRFWLADPRTMELLHYDGFADQFAVPQDAKSGDVK